MSMPRRHRRRAGNRRGQALVEFALVMPILLLLILGLIDFARAWNVYQVITDAAREGARTAVIDDPTVSEDSVRTVIGNALQRASINTDDATIDIDGFRSGRGMPTTVRIEYEYQLGWIGALVAFAQGDDLLTLTTEIVMRNE
jgi:Flp pilus assembly protein TadG